MAGQWRKSKSLEIQQESSLSQQKVISPFDFKNDWKIITIKDTNFRFTDIKLHRLYFIEETILYLSIKANICLKLKKIALLLVDCRTILTFAKSLWVKKLINKCFF